MIAYVEQHPDAYLSEIGEHFGCSAEAVRQALKDWESREKKTVSYQERDEKRREKFRKIIALIAKEGIVFINETGMDQYLSRPYRRAPKGLPPMEKSVAENPREPALLQDSVASVL